MEPKRGIYVGNNNTLIDELKNLISGSTLNTYNDTAEGISSLVRDKVDYLILESAAFNHKIDNVLDLIEANIPLKSFVVILIKPFVEPAETRELLSRGINDIYNYKTDPRILKNRIWALNDMLLLNNRYQAQPSRFQYKVPVIKRIFDIMLAGTALLFLSPVFVITAIFIRLESKGSVFYASKRVGTGFRIFDFYKFRSMDMNADTKIKELKSMNQYAKDSQKDEKTKPVFKQKIEANPNNDKVLITDDGIIEETEYVEKLRQEAEISFVKIKDDPRITKVGKFIRNTSIDELPQLINVLKGDMSVVGNRPIPLYEAELLTTDEWSERFLAPAGLTGLWQVEKRAKSTEMSPEERKMLDNQYARNYTFWMDIQIIFRTFKALFQSETV